MECLTAKRRFKVAFERIEVKLLNIVWVGLLIDTDFDEM